MSKLSTIKRSDLPTHSRFVNLIGKKFGSTTVVAYWGSERELHRAGSASRVNHWLCQSAGGKICVLPQTDL